MPSKTTQRRCSVMPEWKVSMYFALWLLEEKACNEVMVNLPKTGSEKKGCRPKTCKKINLAAAKLLTGNGWCCEVPKGNRYEKDGNVVVLAHNDGEGDVVAKRRGRIVHIAECKGANSPKRDGTGNKFNECLGQALNLSTELPAAWSVFHDNLWFRPLAVKAVSRVRIGKTGIRLALVNENGTVKSL